MGIFVSAKEIRLHFKWGLQSCFQNNKFTIRFCCCFFSFLLLLFIFNVFLLILFFAAKVSRDLVTSCCMTFTARLFLLFLTDHDDEMSWFSVMMISCLPTSTIFFIYNSWFEVYPQSISLILLHRRLDGGSKKVLADCPGSRRPLRATVSSFSWGGIPKKKVVADPDDPP